MLTRQFQKHILSWYRKNRRRDPRASRRASLPWRHTRDPWRILVSEVMLQQTQVPRVVAKYPTFIRRFPTARALARASLREALAAWQGMGYNRRAVQLRELARTLVRERDGKVPASADELRRLPGIGPNTAGAIRAFAFNKRSVFIETNIRRVFLHHFFRRRRNVPDAEILRVVNRTLPQRNFREWYYALMDYGALALKNQLNPNRRSAHYVRQSAFRGSTREIRGAIVAALVQATSISSISESTLRERVASAFGRKYPARKFSAIVALMAKERIITKRDGRIAISR